MRTVWQDLRYGGRMLLKKPGFTLIAVLTLALGIGANTAIFSVLDAILLKPLPVPKPEELVVLGIGDGERVQSGFSYPDYADYRDRNDVLAGMLAYAQVPLSVSTQGKPERMWGQIVSGNYFSVLGVNAARGRTFLPEEDRTPGAHPVTVIGDGMWQRYFNSDPEIIGKTVLLNGTEFTVIGVAPRNFTGAMRGFAPSLWVPLSMHAQIKRGKLINQEGSLLATTTSWSEDDNLSERTTRWLQVIGRLKPDVSRAQAQAALRIIATQLELENPKLVETAVVLNPGVGGHTQFLDDLSLPLKLLMLAVGLILLIACANVANLLLAQSTFRRKEIAIRLALGASRRRLIQQLLTESLLLALMGSAAGMIVALWVRELLLAFQPPTLFIPLVIESTLDRRVLSLTLLATLTGVLFGLAPALQSTRPELTRGLKDESGNPGYVTRSFSLRSLLVVGQVALSAIVLVAAGLFVRSLQNLRAVDPGFMPENILLMSFDLSFEGYSEVRGREFYEQLVQRVKTVPGVRQASLASTIVVGFAGIRQSIFIEDREVVGKSEIDFNMISADYFRTLGIEVVKGRDFDAQDKAGAPGVAIINETMANQQWPGENPVGNRFGLGGAMGVHEKPLEVVGVVKDGKYRSLDERATPNFYLPLEQKYHPRVTLHVRTVGNALTLISAIKREVAVLDSRLPVFYVMTMADHIGSSLYLERMIATLMGFLALLALVLGAIGLYGVMAYTVTQRTREIGIRLALGAQHSDVLQLVVKHEMTVSLIGITLGLGASLALTRLIKSLLFGVSTADPLTFAAIAGLLTSVALLACWIPARRATKVDPMIALRYE